MLSTTTSLRCSCLGELAALRAQRPKALEAIPSGVDVEDNHAFAGTHADIRIGRSTPHAPNRRLVMRRIVQPISGARVLADAPAATSPTGTAVSEWRMQWEYCKSVARQAHSGFDTILSSAAAVAALL